MDIKKANFETPLFRLVISVGFAVSFRIGVRDVLAVPADFSTMQFAAIVKNDSGSWDAVTISKDNATGMLTLTVPASVSLSGLDGSTTTIVIAYRYSSGGQQYALGYGLADVVDISIESGDLSSWT